MKKLISLALSLCMVWTMSSSAFATETGSGTTPVYLSSTEDGTLGGNPSPTAMSVTVPTALPMAVSRSGDVTTATDCKIINNSYGAVRIKSVTISAANGWKLTSFGDKSILASEKVDANKLGFAMTIGGGQQIKTDGSDPSSQVLLSAPVEGCYMSGAGDPAANTAAVNYSAIVTPLSSAVTNANIANVVFVIEWDTAESIPVVKDYTLSAALPENGVTPEGYGLNTVQMEDVTYVFLSSTGAAEAYQNTNGEEGCWVGIALDIPASQILSYTVTMDYENSTAANDYYIKDTDGFRVYFNAQGYDAASVSLTLADGKTVSYEVDFSGVVLPESAAYTIWSGKQEPILAKTGEGVPQLQNLAKTWIYKQDETAFTDKYEANWLLGVTIESYKGSLLATWGFDKGTDADEAYPNVTNKENTLYEETYYSWSHDGGTTWSAPVKFTPFAPPEDQDWATTHGISFMDGDTLYYMLNGYQARNSATGVRPAWVELLRWDDTSASWEYVATCATNFQVQSKPVKMNDGHWFMAGCVTVIGESGYAVSDQANDLSSFTCTKTPGVSGSTSTKYISETSFWYNAQTNRIVLTARANTKDTWEYAEPTLWGVTAAGQENRSPVMVSVSDDSGVTFSELESTGFYTSVSRRVNGYLSDGRPYIIFNHTPRYNDARRRLVIGVGEAGTTSINRVYVLEDFDVDGGTAGGAKSYPDAVIANGTLYVTYADSLYTSITGNRNNAKMISLPESAIPKQTTLTELKLLVAGAGEGYDSEAIQYANAVIADAGRTASEIDMAYLRLEQNLANK